jgi:hypothetical protein
MLQKNGFALVNIAPRAPAFNATIESTASHHANGSTNLSNMSNITAINSSNVPSKNKGAPRKCQL